VGNPEIKGQEMYCQLWL